MALHVAEGINEASDMHELPKVRSGTLQPGVAQRTRRRSTSGVDGARCTVLQTFFYVSTCCLKFRPLLCSSISFPTACTQAVASAVLEQYAGLAAASWGWRVRHFFGRRGTQMCT